MANKPAVLAQYDREYRKYERFAEEVEHQIKCILEEEGIVCNAVTCRLKERDSLSKKIDDKKDKYRSLSELTDIAGVRVITYYDSDVERVCQIVEREFSVDRGNSIDKRKALDPKSFGYCSVHYVVSMSEERLKLPECRAYAGMKCEIQIRTVLQHAWAEIEHDLGYKNEIAIPRDIRRSFSRLAGLLEIADKEFQEIREFLTDYQQEMEAKMECPSPSGQAEPVDEPLDAVTLKILLDTNEDVRELNRQIEQISGMEIREPETPDYYASTLRELAWLDIRTVPELCDVLKREIPLVLYLIKCRLTDRYKEEDEGATLSNVIGLFYLCYAELLVRYGDTSNIVRYLEDNYIGLSDDAEEFAEELLQSYRDFLQTQTGTPV